MDPFLLLAALAVGGITLVIAIAWVIPAALVAAIVALADDNPPLAAARPRQG